MTRLTTIFALVLSLVLPATALLPLMAQSLTADDHTIRQMSLDEALNIMEEGNFQIRLAEYDIEITRSQFRQSNAVFLPQLSLEHTATSTNDPLSVFGFKLKQEAVTSADFSPDLLNSPDPYENFNTVLQVRQPLINLDQIFRRSALKNQLRAANEQLRGTQEYARFQVKDAYYRLLLNVARISVTNTSLKAARENERQVNDFFEQGMISRADYLAAAVRVRDLESRQSQTEDQLQTASENLRFLLGMSEDVVIMPTDSLRITPVSVGSISLDTGFSNSTLQALQYRVKAAKEMVKSAKFNFLPSLNAFGSYEFNDNVLLGTSGENYFIGATLKWDLFNGFNNVGKAMQSQAELEKAEVSYQSQTLKTGIEIEQARRSVTQARNQFELAEASVAQASEDLRIRTNRYNQGMETTTDLLQAEARLSQAQLQRLNALYQYNISLATLELLLEQEFPIN